MLRIHRCCRSVAISLFVLMTAAGAPPLTVIQDILYNADGTTYQGIVSITWKAFEASDYSMISAHTITTNVVNGLLRVQLVPTTNALTPASYQVTYNFGGAVQFNENWAVPPSNVVVRVKDVRISGPGTTVGGNGGGITPPPLTNPIAITDVTGLAAALSLRAVIGTGYATNRTAVIDGTGSLEAAAGNATDCVHVDGSSAPCSGGTTGGSGPVFVDGEMPAGAINGSNAAFTLGSTPTPALSLQLFRNGELLRQGADYSLTSNNVTFLARVPQLNDILIASYRTGVNNSGISFIDAEVPAGAVNGSNLSFTLTQAPNPISSLALYRNGLRLRANLDYTVVGGSITFGAGLAPQTGDILQAYYRVPGTTTQ